MRVCTATLNANLQFTKFGVISVAVHAFMYFQKILDNSLRDCEPVQKTQH